MSEVKSLRFNNPELETWVEEHVAKGDLNPLMNQLLERYRREQEQEYAEQVVEEKTERKIVLFQGIMFLTLAIWFFVFALSHFYDWLSIIATFLLVLNGILLTMYVLIWKFTPREKRVSEATE